MSRKTKLQLEKGEQYPVDSFILNEDTTFTLILKEDKTEVKVDYKNPFHNADIYCNIRAEKDHNLKGVYAIELSESGQLKLSEKLFEAIKKKIAKQK